MGLDAIVCTDEHQRDRANALACALGIDLAQCASTNLTLLFDHSGVSLCDRAGLKVQADFVTGSMGFRRRREEGESLLMKAVGARGLLRPKVWDLTAGLGQDSFVLASLGCELRCFERDPVVYELLHDGFIRAELASVNDATLVEVLAKINYHHGDARAYSGMLSGTEVLYLDPMFPERRKSAKVKKNMQLLQQLLKENRDDGKELFTWAISAGAARVVVKRPKRAPPLSSKKPSLQLVGKSVRFDVYPHKTLAGSV